MDPIIPHKEEREAHRQSATARPKGSNGSPPPTLHWPVGARGWLARLAVPGALLLLIAVQYNVHSRDIASLQSRIEALQASETAASLHAQPAPDNNEAPPLAEQLARHSDLIRTLEQRLATQIVELDSLRTSTSDSFAEQISVLEQRLAQLDDELNKRIDGIESDGKQQLATQLAAITSLQDDSGDLADALANATDEIARLRDEGPALAVSSPSPALVDDARLNSFGTRLDDAVARLESQDAELNNWLVEMEERFIATELRIATEPRATQAPPQTVADAAEIDHIRKTLALLKKQHPFVKFSAD